jgi:hypothetical protein
VCLVVYFCSRPTSVHCTVLYRVQSGSQEHLHHMVPRGTFFTSLSESSGAPVEPSFYSTDVSRTANVKNDVTSPRLMGKKPHCHVTDTVTIAIKVSLH